MASLPPGYALTALDRVDSTSAEAHRRALDGAPDGTVIFANSQDSGRGRRGRAWESPPGNLYCSLILRPAAPLKHWPNLSFIAALAVADTLDKVLGFPDFARCKWPNDVLLDGAKVAGILLETAGLPQAPCVILGIGINVLHHPEDTPYPATALSKFGVEKTARAITEDLIGALDTWRKRWERDGFGGIRNAWVARAVNLGERIVVRTADQELHGTFLDLDPEGALILECQGKKQLITAGDVFAEGGRHASRH
ncbi:MAG: biotin--[acetyl-CoA-carboxylase] ligase [Magnetospiraceae bacterium]